GIFARRGSAGAGSAADAGEAFGVEGVHGHAVGLVVVLDFLQGPVGPRIDLAEPAVVMIDLDLADIGPARPLIAAQAGDPGVEPFEHAADRLHLAHIAAQQARLDAT